MPEKYSPIEKTLFFKYMLIYFIAIIVHFVGFKSSDNWIRLDVLFILGYSIVHLQFPIMYISTDLIDPLHYALSIKEGYINYGVWLSSVGGVIWLLGFNVFNFKNQSIDKKLIINENILIWVSWILFLGFVFTAGSEYLSGSVYIGLTNISYGTGISPYFQLLAGFLILVISAIIIHNYAQDTDLTFFNWLRSVRANYIILVSFNILLFLWIGDRGGAITIIFTLLFLVGNFIRKIKLHEFLIVFILGALIMTIIGIGRATPKNKNIFSAGIENLELSSFYNITQELAGSATVLYLALEEVPDNHEFFHGRTMLGNILNTIPFAQSAYMELTNTKAYYYNSAEYLTYTALGENPHTGLGSTIIADIYINFGFYGVILLMFTLGSFYKYLHCQILFKDNIFWIIIASIVAGYSFYLPRSTYFLYLRYFVYTIILFQLFFKKQRALNNY